MGVFCGELASISHSSSSEAPRIYHEEECGRKKSAVKKVPQKPKSLNIPIFISELSRP